MPTIIGTVRDVAGNLANGTLSIRAKDVRRNATGDALVDERTHKIQIVNGVITASPVIDPGPVVISLSTPGKYRTWEAVVPTGTSVDLWDVIEQYVDYSPPVVGAAQQAAADAQTAAANAAAAVQAEIADDVAAAQAAATLAQEAAAEATGGIALDTDGVPYFTAGSGAVSLDTDGVPYLTGV